MTVPDFTDLPLESIVATLFFLAAIDTVGSIVIAIGAGTFNGEYVTGFLVTHVRNVWLPIVSLGLLGTGVPAVNIPPIPAASLAATAGLTAYAVATLASLKGSVEDKSAVPTPPVP